MNLRLQLPSDWRFGLLAGYGLVHIHPPQKPATRSNPDSLPPKGSLKTGPLHKLPLCWSQVHQCTPAGSKPIGFGGCRWVTEHGPNPPTPESEPHANDGMAPLTALPEEHLNQHLKQHPKIAPAQGSPNCIAPSILRQSRKTRLACPPAPPPQQHPRPPPARQHPSTLPSIAKARSEQHPQRRKEHSPDCEACKIPVDLARMRPQRHQHLKQRPQTAPQNSTHTTTPNCQTARPLAPS